MAKVNYKFEKRQKDMAKQRKQADKQQRKANKQHSPGVDEEVSLGTPGEAAEPQDRTTIES